MTRSYHGPDEGGSDVSKDFEVCGGGLVQALRYPQIHRYNQGKGRECTEVRIKRGGIDGWAEEPHSGGLGRRKYLYRLDKIWRDLLE